MSAHVIAAPDDAFGQQNAHPAEADTALAGAAAGPEALRPLVGRALSAMDSGIARRRGPLSAGGPSAVDADVAAAFGEGPLPQRGIGAAQAVDQLVTALTAGTADPADPACAGHLHCPPLAVAVAADLVASALNPSLDSWDQGPAAIAVEDQMIRSLNALAGFDEAGAGGTFTSGGTESNLTALLLAREHADAPITVLASELAHFSLARAAGVLGLGEDAVVAIPADRDGRLRPDVLDASLAALSGPAVVVATAGTTDLGSIDPLEQIADIVRSHGAWMHVDAAYGGGALLSQSLAPLVAGLAEAHTASLDFHKLGWQPIAAGVLLVRDAALLETLERRVAYLNPVDDERAGFPSTLGRSLRTTRRLDALKLAVTFRALGRDGLGALVDACHGLARHAAAAIEADPRLTLEADPVLTSVVFRFTDDAHGDEVNGALRRRLLREGRAVVGRTELPGSGPGRVRLKLTLLNPHATPADVDAVLADVVDAGLQEQALLRSRAAIVGAGGRR
jgi:L-2,4-diaminobutyrate decarboxylase